MNRIAALMLMDFRSLSILRKIILLIFPVLIFWAFFLWDSSSEKLYGAFIIFLILTSVTISRPFTMTEHDRQDMLLSTLPLTPGDIVKARYLFFICTQVFFAFPPLFIKFIFFPNNEIIYFFIIFVFLAASFFAALMYPISFVSSSYPMRIFEGIPFFMIIILKSESWVNIHDNPSISAMSSVIAVAAGLTLLCLSCLLSLKFYRAPDLPRRFKDDESRLTLLKLN